MADMLDGGACWGSVAAVGPPWRVGMACALGHADGMWMSALSLFTLHIKAWAVIKRRDPPRPQSNWLFQHFISETACARLRKPTCILKKSVLKWTPPPPLLHSLTGSVEVRVGGHRQRYAPGFVISCCFYEHINIQGVHYQCRLTEHMKNLGFQLKMARKWPECATAQRLSLVSWVLAPRCTCEALQ